jgi:hypothetical protein
MPPRYTLAVAQPLWDDLLGTLSSGVETAAVVLAGLADDPERPTLLVNSIRWIDDASYVRRERLGLRIASHGWVPALKRAADAGLHAMFFHSHPGGEPTPSSFDGEVDAALAGPFRNRTRTDLYASLILGGTSERPEFTGRVVHASGDASSITRIRVAGTRLQILPAFDEPDGQEVDRLIHDRQIRAFGTAGHQKLSQVRIGVVGAGGTGSAVAEQLIRLGVQGLVTIDDDVITSTNVSRVYGSTMADTGTPKVEVVAANAHRIGLGTQVAARRGRVNARDALDLLRGCDVIFGCTDDHLGRFNLSRLCFYYLVPLIDLGVVIDAMPDRIRSITGRITYVAPGQACLVCAGVVDPNRVREEGYTAEERASLVEEGYARGLDEPDPSVIAYTTMVAAWGIADLLERLFGFGRSDVSSEIRLRIADRKMANRSPQPEPGHICADPSKWGLGDQASFLGQRVWPS